MFAVKQIIFSLQVMVFWLILEDVFGLERAAFEEMDAMSHFAKKGTVKLCHFRADIFIDINLTDLVSAVNVSCGMIGKLWGSTRHTIVHPEMRTRVDELCMEDTERVATIMDFLTGDSTDRPRRFVGALLAALVWQCRSKSLSISVVGRRENKMGKTFSRAFLISKQWVVVTSCSNNPCRSSSMAMSAVPNPS